MKSIQDSLRHCEDSVQLQALRPLLWKSSSWRKLTVMAEEQFDLNLKFIKD